MPEGIREIGIFLVIAQAVLYFVPGEAYEKYVKVMIGVIMIALAAQSVLGAVKGEKGEEIRLASKEFKEILEKEPELPGWESSKMVFEGMERELAEYEQEEGKGTEDAAIKSGKAEFGKTESEKRKQEKENEKIRIEKKKVDKITAGGKEQALQ